MTANPGADLEGVYTRKQRGTTVHIFAFLPQFRITVFGPVYTGPDKFGTCPLRDLTGSVPKRSHESGPKLFRIARPFTWDRIIHQIAKGTAVFVERHLVVEDESPPKVKTLRNKLEKQVSLGHREFMLKLGYCKNLLLDVHFGC